MRTLTEAELAIFDNAIGVTVDFEHVTYTRHGLGWKAPTAAISRQVFLEDGAVVGPHARISGDITIPRGQFVPAGLWTDDNRRLNPAYICGDYTDDQGTDDNRPLVATSHD